MLPFHYNDYSSTATYWANGAVNTLNPLNSSALPTFTYGVDGEGRPNSVSASSGISPIPSANPVTYNVASEMTGLTLGSGDSDSFGFDTNTFRMTNYTVSVGASPNTKTVSGNLTWNANGTLQQLAISDQFNSANTQTCTYLYDDLARLSGNASSPGVNCGASTWQQYFTYDAFGNISKNVPTGGTGTSFQPTYNASTNRYTLSGANVTFDANGNTTQDNAHSYSWDAEGRPVQVDGIGLTYDAFGRMVEQNRSGSYTQILYSPKGDKLALMNGQTVSKAFIPLPAGAAAVYTSGPTLNYFRHPDWLGSVRFASTTSRTMYSDLGYAPFGETYAEAGTPDRSFTGQNQDPVSGPTAGLYDFTFREYAQYGRWVSPDPAGVTAANPSSPQTWNRYAYVGNNPVLGTDPTGLDPSCDLACKQRKLNDDIPFLMMFGYSAGCGEVFGFPAPCITYNAVITSGAGVICPQCQPGQVVGMDGTVYNWEAEDCPTNSPNGCLKPAPNQPNVFAITTAANKGPSADPTFNNRANALAQAIKRTGVQTLQSPCAPVIFYGGSALVATGAAVVSGGQVFPELASSATPMAAQISNGFVNFMNRGRQLAQKAVSWAAATIIPAVGSTCSSLMP